MAAVFLCSFCIARQQTRAEVTMILILKLIGLGSESNNCGVSDAGGGVVKYLLVWACVACLLPAAGYYIIY